MTSEPELAAVSPATLDHFMAARTTIMQATVARALQRPAGTQPGADAERQLTIGLDFTTQALGVAMQVGNATLLDQQLQWGNQRLPHDGVTAAQLLARFQILAAVVDETLSAPDAQTVNRFVDQLIRHQAAFMQTLEP